MGMGNDPNPALEHPMTPFPRFALKAIGTTLGLLGLGTGIVAYQSRQIRRTDEALIDYAEELVRQDHDEAKLRKLMLRKAEDLGIPEIAEPRALETRMMKWSYGAYDSEIHLNYERSAHLLGFEFYPRTTHADIHSPQHGVPIVPIGPNHAPGPSPRP